MAQKKPKPSAGGWLDKISKAKLPVGGEWLDKISDLFRDVDMNLDQVKKSVKDDLSKLREMTGESLAANLYLSAEEGLKKDLEELGIYGEAQKEHLESFKKAWQKQEMGKKSSEILNSPELAAIDNFITDPENLPKIREVIESAEPQSKCQAMLKGLARKYNIPGLDKIIDDYLGPLLSALGLGFLVKTKKKKEEADKEEGAKGKKDKPKTKAGPKEKLADLPETWVPGGKTLIMGDSNLADNKKLIFKKGRVDLVAKGSQPASWALTKIKQMDDDRINEYDNLVLGFGGNDLGAKEPDEILKHYRLIVEHVREANKKKGEDFKTKIFIVTTPPIGKDKSSLFEKKREKLNDLIKKARAEGTIDFDEVIDMAATVKNGVVTSNDKDKSGEIAEGLNREGDPVHVKRGEYAKRVRFGM